MFLNTTTEEIKEEYKLIAGDEEIKIEIPASKFFRIVKDTNGMLWFKFKIMTVENYWFIEKYAKEDSEEFKKLILKYQIIDCNLDIDLEFENEILTDKSWKELLNLPAPLLSEFVNKYQDSYLMDREEEIKLERQTAILFSPNTGGVENACETIKLYCVLGNFWEKFGINRFDLKKLSYKEYIGLRMVLNNQIDRTKATQKQHKKPQTMIAGMGGRTRPSRGIQIPNPD